MSFLNSILSSISTGATPPPLLSNAAAQKEIVRPGASSTTPSMTSLTTKGTLKRKADNDRNDVPLKTFKHTGAPAFSPIKPSQPVGGASVKVMPPPPRNGVSSPTRTGKATTSSKVSNSSSNGIQKCGVPRERINPSPPSSAGLLSPELHKKVKSSMPPPAPPAPAAGPAVTSTAPLKKGSYKEIMARAQALKAQQTDFMQITHKPVAKMTKKERLAHEAELLLKGEKQAKDVLARKPNPGTTRASLVESHEKKRQPIDLGYSGTMRGQLVPPKAGSSNASLKPKPAPLRSSMSTKPSTSKHDSRPRAGGGRYTYASYSDEGDQDEEDDYDSESDMEAGGLYELEREEMTSLRAAKVEDARTLRELEEHDRMKRERRRNLEQLAARKR